LIQAISNLLSNALKFAKEGTGRDTISITKEKNDNQEVIISVRDSGEGIDPEILLKQFKFASKSFERTVLGLFNAKSIIAALGGKIWTENNSNNNNINTHKEKGDIFYFNLATSDDDLM
jgi:signal transduction histidine kinase